MYGNYDPGPHITSTQSAKRGDVRPLVDARADTFKVADTSCAGRERPSDAVICTGPLLQHGVGQNPVGIFQILNQFDANATNEPLKTKASTLSRTNLITIQ